MSGTGDSHQYDDIIHLPHRVSDKRARMSMIDRGAQFSPFAALTGYDAAIRETARLTGERIELSESSKAMLNEKLQMLLELLDEQPEVRITYFLPDERKAGGEYVSVAGRVKKLDAYRRVVVMTDGTEIFIEEISRIEGRMFLGMD